MMGISHPIRNRRQSQVTQTLEQQKNFRNSKKSPKTINSWCSLVVTHPTTIQPAHGLSVAERTGSTVFHVLW
jgi:hypothetical protein